MMRKMQQRSLLLSLSFVVACVFVVISSAAAATIERRCAQRVPSFLHQTVATTTTSPPSSGRHRLSPLPPRTPATPPPVLTAGKCAGLFSSITTRRTTSRPSSLTSGFVIGGGANQSLRDRILNGARDVLRRNHDGGEKRDAGDGGSVAGGERRFDDDGKDDCGGDFRYYIREGRRSEMDKIADLLMDAFHRDDTIRPTFDSYIRRYKLNHLAMCFDAIDGSHMSLLVACAVPKGEDSDGGDPQPSSDGNDTENEIIVGFCAVDGRPNDPDSRVEHATPTSVASTPPRPYLSDLGVSPRHRRRGIGVALVRACEKWVVDASALSRSDGAGGGGSGGGPRRRRVEGMIYLRVDGDNAAARGLYLGKMGYEIVSLPFGGHPPGSTAAKYDKTVLLRKSLVGDDDAGAGGDGKRKMNSSGDASPPLRRFQRAGAILNAVSEKVLSRRTAKNRIVQRGRARVPPPL